MKYLPILFLFFLINKAFAQESTAIDSTFIYSGYVFDTDSLPIEGACLLNCKTLRAVITDESGFFKTRVETGDSLVINHISYKRKFVFANRNNPKENSYYVDLRPYELSPVLVKDYAYDLANFEKNMACIYKQLGMLEKPVDYKSGNLPNTANPYAPGATAPGFGINILDLFRKK